MERALASMSFKSKTIRSTGARLDDKQLKDIFYKAVFKRENLYRVTNAIRLFNSTADGLPGVLVEQYHKHFVIKKLLPVTELDVNPLVEVLVERFAPEYVVVKSRSQADLGKEGEHLSSEILIDKSGSRTVVTENGINFEVDVNDNYNAGLFLDMRSKRQLIGELARGKTLLNCFAYTCSFGVYGRYHGAVKTVNVDISKKTLERGQANYKLNGLTYEPDEFVRTDCLKYLKGAQKWQNHFDIIIVDPPTFARADKKAFIVQKELPRLVEVAVAVLKPEGILLIATNCSSLTFKEVEQMIRTSVPASTKKLVQLTRLEQEADFPGSQNMKESHLTAILAMLHSRAARP